MPPRFESEVLPILRTYCWKCHGGEGLTAGLDLRSLPLMLRGGKSGPAAVRGSAEQSLLIKKLAAGEMPPGNELKPTPAHIATLRAWLDAGAPAAYEGGPLSRDEDPPITADDRQWWSFQKPLRPALPQVRNADELRSPIDAFLLARLEAANLRFSPAAAPESLVRRLYLDLIGLPPTPDEVDAFLNDAAPDAYENLVARLLESPHYGERWGRHWLDAAGYVDTIGTDNDAGIMEERERIWKYRDYVIRAFNRDKPFDRFLTEQLAGDELVEWRSAEAFTPEIQEPLIATGFLRQAADVSYAPELNTADIRQQVLLDTVQILATNVLGLTLQCAQCHTHKFDPISHADYYRLAAFLTPAYDAQNWQHSKDRFLADVPPRQRDAIDAHNADVDRQVGELNKQIASLREPFRQKVFDNKLLMLPEAVRADTKSALDTPAEQRSDVQKYLVEKLGPLVNVTPAEVDQALDETARRDTAERNRQISELAASKRSYDKIQALWDVAAAPRSYLFRRGDYQLPGAEVPAGVPGVLDDPVQPFTLPTSLPGGSTTGYRTALARWLTRPDHPLTARVFVNRVWQQYFGRGIVATPDNFGLSGALPTHPELLDWLAVEFAESGWNVKHLQRLIVQSSAYRQSSMAAESARSLDPENLLLGRMPLRRLESEIVRDSILAVSGALDRSPGGPPVPLKPNPDGSVEIDVAKQPTPSSQFRRSLYVFSRRNYHLSELNVFDQPVVAHNCTRRAPAAVVLQSLSLLNSPFVFSQSERLAERVQQSSGANQESRIQTAFRFALCRRPTEDELAASRELLNNQAAVYLAAQPLTSEAAAEAALKNLCQMLLNTNEFLYVP